MPSRLNTIISVSLSFLFMVSVSLEAEAKLLKGVLAGWNQSNWDHQTDGSNYYWFEAKNGFCLGMFAGGNVVGSFGWRGEVLYSRKGALNVETATDENAQPLGEVKYFYNVDYLEIPLLINYTFATGGKINPVLFFGPAFDLELSAEVRAEYPSGVTNNYQTVWGLENTRSTDFSLIFGGGVELTTGPHLILFQIRYVMGLKEVYLNTKNQTISVMAGLGF